MKTLDTPLPIPGTLWPEQGGIFAGLIAINETTLHAIIAAPGDEGQAPEYLTYGPYGPYGTKIENASSFVDGLANTQALASSEHKCPAAEWANKLELNGFADWYLPAQKELNLCYINAQQHFEKDWHWSSTQYSANYAYIQGFGGGSRNNGHKDYTARVRAVRRFIINLAI